MDAVPVQCIRFSSYGTGLKDRGSVSSATWERLESGLGSANVLEIVLRGLVRSFRVNAEESTDVKADVRSVVANVEDRYYVDELTLRYGLAVEERAIQLLLGPQIAINQGQSSLRDLLTVLARVGAYRDPVDISRLASAPTDDPAE